MSVERKKRGRPLGSKNKNLQRIIKTEHDVYIINCNRCNKDFTSNEAFNSHRTMCKKKPSPLKYHMPLKANFLCNKCNKKFKLKNSYDNHVLNEHSETPGSIPCEQCDVVCPNIEVLTTHIENFHDRDVYECEHCDKKFARRAHVIRHLSQRGCDGRRIIDYPCEICDKTFTRKDNLMVHLRLNHITAKEYSCKLCNFSSNNFTKLIRHSQSVHTDVQRFECDHCGKTTSSRAAISKHLEIHGDKKYKCDLCGHNTYTIEVMRRHVLTHIPDKPHKCDICGNSYIQKLQLERHMLKHIGYKCFKCQLTFDNKSKFIKHDREHLNDRDKILCPFKNCIHAKETLRSKEEYTEHMKIHMTDKQYVCNVCDKRFHSETFLKRHVGTHALERPRRCMYCVNPRAYVRGEHLVRHVRKVHPVVFRSRLDHVRTVLGSPLRGARVTKSEIESILNVLDAECDRIIEDYGHGVLYGGLQEDGSVEVEDESSQQMDEDSPLMTEDELAENLKKLLTQTIDKDILECFGWPNESVDTVLEKVVEKMGAKAAARDKWTRVQCLRENTKHLFLHAVEDKAIARMLDTHTIDQIIKHFLEQVATDTIKMEPATNSGFKTSP